ncbi:thioredoxin family protein [Apilactobacillus apisilvae]|uniref:Thioredoxin family protein n=1 Tax=Apilactobacillus apisilvae TaxID=2923364 RepID=A0ABY4PIB7_9LACO|nr:thioredoxin family protein [Apilactobacillus apisilvae]UQS85258.1 thioredoxin family protein [Apilactobacillus apisilvae]
MEQLPKMNLNELKDKIDSGKYILFFTADWCPDCSFIKPAMPEIEAEYKEYTFLTVDRDENIDLAAELSVMGIPSFIAFNNGEEIGRFVNKDRKTKKQVEEFIDSLN